MENNFFSTIYHALWGLIPTEQLIVADSDETNILDTITDSVGPSALPVEVGPGDDAAVISLQDSPYDRVIMSSDTIIEERHFRLPWISPYELGRRAIVHSAADCAAMNAQPIAYTLDLAISKKTPVEAIRSLILGASYQAQLWGGQIVGGDCVLHDSISLSVTVLGGNNTQIGLNNTAQPGDTLALSGYIGVAAAGLECYRSGQYLRLAPAHAQWAVEYCQHKFNVPLGPIDSIGCFQSNIPKVHALTDISDGLLKDVNIMARKSRVSIEIEPALLPIHPAVKAVSNLLGHDIDNWLLGGGEDHILAGTFPTDEVPPGWFPIGTVRPGGPGAYVRGCQSGKYPGWDSISS